MVQMNVEKILKELGIEAEVDHSDLSTAKAYKADIYMTTHDMAQFLEDVDAEVVLLNNIIDLKELKEKLLVGMENVKKKKQ